MSPEAQSMSVKRRAIVTLCGSVRFKADFERANERLTLAGFIVLSVGCFDHAWLHQPENNGELNKDGLDGLHKDKISMSDIVYVLNPGGYIGKSTRSEIDYAHSIGVPVFYMEPTGQPGEVGLDISDPWRPNP